MYECFQSAWSSASYLEERARKKVTMLDGTGKNVWCSVPVIQGKDTERTQIEVFVQYMAQLAEEKQIPKADKMWLPPLDSCIFLEKLEAEKQVSAAGRFSACIGLCDDIKGQRQIPFQVDITQGHCCILGQVASGKSTLLQTFIFELLKKNTPDWLHVYGLDFGNGMFGSFFESPLVGGIISSEKKEQITFFLYFLEEKIRERKRLFQGGNYLQYVEKTKKPYPAIVVVLDHMAAFRMETEDAYTDALYVMLQEAPSLGIYFIVSAGAFGPHEIPSRMQGLFANKITLALEDSYQYMDMLSVKEIPVMPERKTKGRGLVLLKEQVVEFQGALIFDEKVYERGEKIREWCVQEKSRWNGKKAERIFSIPKKPTLEQFAYTKEYKQCIEKKQYLPYAYHGRKGSLVGMDLTREEVFFICGPSGSGKKNAAKVMLHGVEEMGGSLCILGSQEKSLYEYAKKRTAAYYEFGIRQWHSCFMEQASVLRDRMEQKKMGQTDFSPLFFLVEDVYAFFCVVYEEGGNFKEFLENVVEKAEGIGVYWIALLDVRNIALCRAYKSFLTMEKRCAGVFLGEHPAEQNLFPFENLSGVRRSRNRGEGYGTFGKGADTGVPVVLPLAET